MAYWDSGTCGALGDDWIHPALKNSNGGEWYGGYDIFRVDEIQVGYETNVSTSYCPSGKAQLVDKWSTGK